MRSSASPSPIAIQDRLVAIEADAWAIAQAVAEHALALTKAKGVLVALPETGGLAVAGAAGVAPLASGDRISSIEELAQRADAEVCVPVRSGSESVAVLVLLEPTESAAAEQVALVLGAALSRARELDAHRDAATAVERFETLLEHAPIGIGLMDRTGTFVLTNPAMGSITGFSSEELNRMPISAYALPEDFEDLASPFRALLAGEHDSYRHEHRLLDRHGNVLWVDTAISLFPTPSGRRELAIVMAQDITGRRLAELQLRHDALHDPLTGLPNRVLVLDRAEQMLARARRHQGRAAALFLDLDNFKDVNDTYGHSTGDRLLQTVAGRLADVTRGADTVGRLGGDEFVVLLDSPNPGVEPTALAERLLAALRDPVDLGSGANGRCITVTASIGIASGPRSSAEELLRDADTALYAAKQAGRNRALTFQSSMRIDAQAT